MAIRKSLWRAPGLSLLLMSGLTTAVALSAPVSVYAAKKSLTSAERVNVRMHEERRLAKMDRSYVKQQKALAKNYKKRAKLFERQGGDPAVLLDAAAYFDDKTKKQKEKKKVK